MADRILTLRDINRMTLARQLLLERSPMNATAAVERLVGMQAQLASAPYVGLWTRLKDFARDDLASVIERREVVKATLMRATLHLVGAADFLRFRTTLSSVLEGAAESIAKNRAPIDAERVLKIARVYLSEQPRTFAEISAMLLTDMPDSDVGAMRYTVRTHIPLVQVPVSSGWSYPAKPAFTIAEDWMGKPFDTAERLPELVKRYLAAFGPATPADIQAWSFLKLPDVKAAIDSVRPELVTYRDEKKRELLDVADMPPVDGSVDAPIRFLPEFDNLVLSHKDRKRVVADEFRKQVYLPGLRVAATILVDGFVGAVWKVSTAKGVATLTVTPLLTLTQAQRASIADEAERLVRFVEPEAKGYGVAWGE